MYNVILLYTYTIWIQFIINRILANIFTTLCYIIYIYIYYIHIIASIGYIFQIKIVLILI